MLAVLVSELLKFIYFNFLSKFKFFIRRLLAFSLLTASNFTVNSPLPSKFTHVRFMIERSIQDLLLIFFIIGYFNHKEQICPRLGIFLPIIVFYYQVSTRFKFLFWLLKLAVHEEGLL